MASVRTLFPRTCGVLPQRYPQAFSLRHLGCPCERINSWSYVTTFFICCQQFILLSFTKSPIRLNWKLCGGEENRTPVLQPSSKTIYERSCFLNLGYSVLKQQDLNIHIRV